MAISALVLGLLCFVPAVGLVLGLIALSQIRRSGERGKGFAVAGAVLSSVGLALWALLLATGGAAVVWEGFKGAASGEGTAYALDAGQCFDTPDGALEGVTYDVDEVPCAGAHDGEVFAVFDLDDGSFPGDDSITAAADDKCYALRAGYAMDAWAVPANVDVYYLTPTRQSWRAGDREVTCLFGGAARGDVLTGSLRNDRTTLDDHQFAFLKAAAPLDEVLAAEPATAYIEDDLPGHREWAGEVAGALAGQVESLHGHSWPADVERPVAGLAEDLDAAREEWAAAAKASDADTFYEHYDTGYDLIAPAGSVAARKALGLATTPPVYQGGDAGEGGDDPGFEA
ncbi:DUF4190 domain-containing protein [Streptomyces sp. NPDC023723]|uniref:DUF4190 domain-containing protein n=1 Tax=Streptomyces sp. NPDC023723 TaxID=3154323 RepID=UPI0033FE7664